MNRRIVLVIVVVGAVAALGVGTVIGLTLVTDDPAPVIVHQPAEATQPVPSPTPEVDPYDVWLQRAPAEAPELSRDDAFTRAYLGCGQTWPPGTVDRILQEVYADYLDCPN